MNRLHTHTDVLFISAGILFSFIWASASTATRLALESAQPLFIAVSRFFLAALLMLLTGHLLLKLRLPRAGEWKQLAVYGMLNISIYLGMYVFAMQKVSAGLGTLAVCTNPVFITLFTALFKRQPVNGRIWLSLLVCSAGIGIASWPLIRDSYATTSGILLLIFSMLAYSAGAVYYTRCSWKGLHLLVINGWQTLLGGLFLLPLMLVLWKGEENSFTGNFWGGVLWLAVPVSIGAVHLWMYLLKKDPVKSSFWLYLCPVFGFAIARWVLAEPLSMFTGAGVFLVVAGLIWVQRSKQV